MIEEILTPKKSWVHNIQTTTMTAEEIYKLYAILFLRQSRMETK
jgi:hypothetical protein